MIKKGSIINQLMYESVIDIIAEKNKVSLEEAKSILSSMSFKDYYAITEQNITPPSGQTLGPSNITKQSMSSTTTATPPDEKEEEVVGWTGVGPITQGVTVGLQHDRNKIVPGKVEKVDVSNKTITILDPTTNKPQVYSNSDPRIQKFMVKTGTTQKPTAPPTTPTQTTEEISRLKHLAGIVENSSAGAVSAGNVAVAIKELGDGGQLLRRSKTEERWAKEYKKPPGNKTIVGDTKPSQASSELSANLVANNKVSASRGKKLK
jgi:hypothetical protein